MCNGYDDADADGDADIDAIARATVIALHILDIVLLKIMMSLEVTAQFIAMQHSFQMEMARKRTKLIYKGAAS